MSEQLWAMEREALQAHLEKVENATPEEVASARASFPMYPDAGLPEINDGVAILRVEGVLVKNPIPPIYRFFGIRATSYVELRAQIASLKEQVASGAVSKCRVLYDTPGGMMDGLDETYQAMVDLATVVDVEAEVSGMCCSAGYYLASCSKRITATAPTDLIGSIGVLVVHTSYKKMDERYGIKEIIITSKNAPDKAPDPETAKGRKVVQDRVDALERIFYQRISEGRGVSTEYIAKNFGRGGVLVAYDPDESMPDAVRVKMIDAVNGVKTNNYKGESKMINKAHIELAVNVLKGIYPAGIKALADRILNGDSGAVESLNIAKTLFDSKDGEEDTTMTAEDLRACDKKFMEEVAQARARYGLPPVTDDNALPAANDGIISTQENLDALAARDRQLFELN